MIWIRIKRKKIPVKLMKETSKKERKKERMLMKEYDLD